MSSPSLPTFNLSRHQSLFKWSILHIRWPKYWSFSFSISPSNEYSGLISFRMDWLDLLESKGLSRVFSNTTVQKHQFFSVQSPSFLSKQGFVFFLKSQQETVCSCSVWGPPISCLMGANGSYTAACIWMAYDAVRWETQERVFCARGIGEVRNICLIYWLRERMSCL